MVRVTISYNIFCDVMSIYIDGEPIPLISRLTRLQTLPFGFWCADIFGAVSEEVNDEFSLTYVGRPCESRILRTLMTQNRSCVSYVNRQPEIADSALVRLKKLSALCQSGAACDRFSAVLNVYTDEPEQEARLLTEGCLPKLAFCRVTVKLHPLSELSTYAGSDPALVLTDGDASRLRLPTGGVPVCVLLRDEENRLESCGGNCFVERVRAQEMQDRVKEYLELLFFPALLRRALGAAHIPENSPLFLSAAILDKMEPQTVVTLPSSIELGETAPLKVRTVPENAQPAQLICRISDETVIRETDGGLEAVGTGEAVVEVYAVGQTAKLCSGRITAYRRNRIRQLTLRQQELQLCVGDRATLSYGFEPADADDESSIQLVSSDGTVAAPERGCSFVARSPGTCRMIVRTAAVSAAANVTVYPRLEALSMHMEESVVPLDAVVPVQITRTPAGATLDKLTYTVSPPSLGVYDVGTGSFYAKQEGEGTLVVANKAGTVRAVQEITVRSQQRANAAVRWVPVMVGLGLLAAYIISRFL